MVILGSLVCIFYQIRMQSGPSGALIDNGYHEGKIVSAIAEV
jgi:hypothetical protein